MSDEAARTVSTRADDDQVVAEPRRAEVADGDFGDGIDAVAGVERGALVDPERRAACPSGRAPYT